VLKGKNILFGVTGSIAVYKSIDVIRRLMAEEASVNVVMTEAACRFIPPYTFEAVTGMPVFKDIFQDSFSHINLPKEAGLFIIAPATANTISKFACGIADNLLTSIYLAYEGAVLIAPAMNSRMYRHAVVKKHIAELSEIGVKFIGPEEGSLACGEEGIGRMSDPSDIVEAVITALTPKDLTGQKILVTAGPTIEPIDPVRFISNRSSGKMGYAIARAALRRGAEVTLISGPTSLTPPRGAHAVSVENAAEMEKAVLKNFRRATSLIMAAAVSDFTPAVINKSKLKKSEFASLKLKETSDILKRISPQKGKRVIIGFAAETGRNIENVQKKLKEKKLDLIVLNDVSEEGAGFGVDTNIVTIIDKKGSVQDYPLMKKIEVADIILDRLHDK
jgi:phosphopantothenoylcysteine decarboxylase/phosphopantothenate--cysteine ligase